jgi:phosphohistidine phosphatase
MELILWRHAEAEVAVGQQADDDRPLTAKGRIQAERMAQWLDQHLPANARLLVSPAVRAQQTAAALVALGRKLRTVDAIGTRASAHDLLQAAAWPDFDRPVVLVGHQPTLGQAIHLLLTGQPGEWAVKKGAVWWLRNRERDENQETVVLTVQHPQFLLAVA